MKTEPIFFVSVYRTALFVTSWFFIAMLVGSLHGLGKVVFFEIDDSGKYAILRECLEYEYGPGSSSGCIESEIVGYQPLGLRIKDEMKRYAIYWGIGGFVLALFQSGHKLQEFQKEEKEQYEKASN